jgi:D-glycero-D-manno-heptose 1,7-bisphosphate phosphatase
MNRAVFLDRDGVINRKAPEGGYITRWEDMHFLPDVAGAIHLLNRAGLLVIVVSNQRCVAKGLLTIRELESLHRRMREKLAEDGARIDGIYYCPHEYDPPCDCRKPAPGMLLEAARSHQIDLAASWMIGDTAIDIQAGKNAGCRTALLLNNEGVSNGADVVARSLPDAVEQILQRDGVNLNPQRKVTTL